MKILLDPTTRIGAVTAVGPRPDIGPGDTVQVTMRVSDVHRCPVGNGACFYSLTLEPTGVNFTVGTQPFHVETEIQRMEPAPAELVTGETGMSYD